MSYSQGFRIWIYINDHYYHYYQKMCSMNACLQFDGIIAVSAHIEGSLGMTDLAKIMLYNCKYDVSNLLLDIVIY